MEAHFDGEYTLHFHLGAWPLARRDPKTGDVRKRGLGPWVLKAMGVLQHLRRVRGTPLDPFRKTPKRKLAAELLARYEAAIAYSSNMRVSLRLRRRSTRWPDKVRGYGPMRERHAQALSE